MAINSAKLNIDFTKRKVSYNTEIKNQISLFSTQVSTIQGTINKIKTNKEDHKLLGEAVLEISEYINNGKPIKLNTQREPANSFIRELREKNHENFGEICKAIAEVHQKYISNPNAKFGWHKFRTDPNLIADRLLHLMQANQPALERAGKPSSGGSSEITIEQPGKYNNNYQSQRPFDGQHQKAQPSEIAASRTPQAASSQGGVAPSIRSLVKLYNIAMVTKGLPNQKIFEKVVPKEDTIGNTLSPLKNVEEEFKAVDAKEAIEKTLSPIKDMHTELKRLKNTELMAEQYAKLAKCIVENLTAEQAALKQISQQQPKGITQAELDGELFLVNTLLDEIGQCNFKDIAASDSENLTEFFKTIYKCLNYRCLGYQLIGKDSDHSIKPTIAYFLNGGRGGAKLDGGEVAVAAGAGCCLLECCVEIIKSFL